MEYHEIRENMPELEATCSSKGGFRHTAVWEALDVQSEAKL